MIRLAIGLRNIFMQTLESVNNKETAFPGLMVSNTHKYIKMLVGSERKQIFHLLKHWQFLTWEQTTAEMPIRSEWSNQRKQKI